MVTEHDRRLQSTSPLPSPTTYYINRKVTGTASPTPLKYRNTTCTLRRIPLKILRLVPGSFSARSRPEGTETELVEELDVVEASKRRRFDGEVKEQEEVLTDSGSEQPSDDSETGRKKSVLSNRLAVMADTGTDTIEFAVPPERESTEKKIDGPDMDTEPPQSATHPSNEAGIEAKCILPNTDTVVQVSENDSDRETMTKDSNFFGKVAISNETPDEQKNDRGNVDIHIDLDKVQQAQASDSIGRQQRKAAGRTRKRLCEVIDLTDETASGPSSSGNITEMYSDADGIFVRKRVRPNGTPNEVVTIASDDEQEAPPVNLAGRVVDGPAISQSHRLHVPIRLNHTITARAFTAPRSEDFDRVENVSNNNENMNENDNEVEIDGTILSNGHLSNEEERDISGQRHFDGIQETGYHQDLSNDKEMPSGYSYPPIVVGDSSTGNAASISSPSSLIVDARTERGEIITLDDDDGIPNTRPSPTPCAPLAHPQKGSLTSHIEQFPQLECSVCLDIPQFLSYTDCGHVYCEECIRSAVKVHHKCPVCRKKLTLANIRILQPLLQFEA